MLKYYFPKYVYKKIYVPKIHTVHEPHKLVHTNVKGYFNTEYIDIITLHNIWCSEYLVPTFSLVRSVMLLCIYVKVYIWVSNTIQSLWTLFMYIYLHPSNQKYSINSYMYIMQVHVHVCKISHSIVYMYSMCTLTSSNLEVKKKWETVWILAQVYDIFIYNRIKIVFQINTCTCKVNSKCFYNLKH